MRFLQTQAFIFCIYNLNIKREHLDLSTVIYLPALYYEGFRIYTKLKEFYSENLDTHHLIVESAIYILLLLLYHVSTHPSPTNPSNLSHAFKSEQQARTNFLKTST